MDKKFKVYFWAAISTEVEAIDVEDAEKWGSSLLGSIKYHIEKEFKINIDSTDILVKEIKKGGF